MDRDELVEALKAELRRVRLPGGPPHCEISQSYVEDIIAALSSPCAFCRGLGYIVNPDDLKREPCYCQETCACGGKEPIWDVRIPKDEIALAGDIALIPIARGALGVKKPVRLLLLDDSPGGKP